MQASMSKIAYAYCIYHLYSNVTHYLLLWMTLHCLVEHALSMYHELLLYQPPSSMMVLLHDVLRVVRMFI